MKQRDGVYRATKNMLADAGIKFEDGRLWILSMDGKSWSQLFAESETRFFVKGEEDYRFEFIRNDSGRVSGLRMEFQAIRFPAAKRLDSQ